MFWFTGLQKKYAFLRGRGGASINVDHESKVTEVLDHICQSHLRIAAVLEGDRAVVSEE